MSKKLTVAIIAGALACGGFASSASAKQNHTKQVPAPQQQQSESIPGVNPMTNSPAEPAVANPQPFVKSPGVNPN